MYIEKDSRVESVDDKQLKKTEMEEMKEWQLEEVHAEMQKLNEKMDLILSILQKKPKKSTIAEVDKKVDSLINILERKMEE